MPHVPGRPAHSVLSQPTGQVLARPPLTGEVNLSSMSQATRLPLEPGDASEPLVSPALLSPVSVIEFCVRCGEAVCSYIHHPFTELQLLEGEHLFHSHFLKTLVPTPHPGTKLFTPLHKGLKVTHGSLVRK